MYKIQTICYNMRKWGVQMDVGGQKQKRSESFPLTPPPPVLYSRNLGTSQKLIFCSHLKRGFYFNIVPVIIYLNNHICINFQKILVVDPFKKLIITKNAIRTSFCGCLYYMQWLITVHALFSNLRSSSIF